MNTGPADRTDSEPERLSDVMARTLIMEIAVGDLKVGETLPTERTLCERFEASRPTVREALALMQMKGYISTSTGKRPRADKPSIRKILLAARDHMREILGNAESGAHLEQLRQFIETGAAMEAAKNASNLQIVQIRSALEANYAAIGTDNFPATDIAFHRALVSVIGNPILLTLHDMFANAMLSYRPPVDDQQKADEMTYNEHQAIYEDVLSGDILDASDTMDRHLARSYRSRLSKPSKVLPSR